MTKRNRPCNTDELRQLGEKVNNTCKACRGKGGTASNPCKACNGSGQVRPKPL